MTNHIINQQYIIIYMMPSQVTMAFNRAKLIYIGMVRVREHANDANQVSLLVYSLKQCIIVTIILNSTIFILLAHSVPPANIILNCFHFQAVNLTIGRQFLVNSGTVYTLHSEQHMNSQNNRCKVLLQLKAIQFDFFHS